MVGNLPRCRPLSRSPNSHRKAAGRIQEPAEPSRTFEAMVERSGGHRERSNPPRGIEAVSAPPPTFSERQSQFCLGVILCCRFLLAIEVGSHIVKIVPEAQNIWNPALRGGGLYSKSKSSGGFLPNASLGLSKSISAASIAVQCLLGLACFHEQRQGG